MITIVQRKWGYAQLLQYNIGVEWGWGGGGGGGMHTICVKLAFVGQTVGYYHMDRNLVFLRQMIFSLGI